MTNVVRPSQYFEGILQLRNPNKKVIDFILNSVKKQSKKGIFISKQVRVKNGIDFYLSSRKYLRTLGGRLFSEFGGKISFNEQLFSRDKQTGKNIYRLNVLFKVPYFEKDDVVEFGGKLVLVKKVGKKVSGTDIIGRKKVSFNYSEKISKLPTYKTTISRIKPNVEVLHPETYESVEVKNKRLGKLVLGEKVRIVIFKGEVYVV